MKQPIDPNFLVHPSTFWHQFMLGRIGRSSSFMERLVGLGYFQKEERSSDQLTLIIRIYDICIGCIGIYRGTNANHLLIINSFILPWKKGSWQYKADSLWPFWGPVNFRDPCWRFLVTSNNWEIKYRSGLESPKNWLICSKHPEKVEIQGNISLESMAQVDLGGMFF